MTTRRTTTKNSAAPAAAASGADRGTDPKSTLELKIGVVHSPREITVETDMTADDVRGAVDTALADGSLIDLPDIRGRRVLIAPGQLAYLDIGEPSSRRVGFGG
ncbi:MAG: DUF3107 domain-containing protein [Candidatus Nanopelagicales bacterium]|nr:DUF3107 domain-containing protein [Candidatus Nanopelagicales bacterium]